MLKLISCLAASGAACFSAALAQIAPIAPIEETVLSRDAFATGLLGRDAGALPPGLWRGSNATTLTVLLARAPLRPSSPAIGVALRRVLLTSGDGPSHADAALGGAKLRALARLGFVEEAREIESLAIGGKTDAAVLEALATADLLSGDQAGACAKVQRIAAPRDTPFGVKLRAFCYAVVGELDAADLALGLLRERGALSAADEAMLGPLVAGGKPKAGAAVSDPVHYAAQKFAAVPLALSPDAEAGVLGAVAADPGAALPARLDAAKRAAAMGVISAAALKDLFGAAALDLAVVAGGAEAFNQHPDDAMALAAAFQLARSKSAPEFARDRAALVAGVLGGARDFETLFLAAALFADDVRGFDGLFLSKREAEAFALARLALGDVAGAQRWLEAGAAGGLGADEPSPVQGLVAAAKAGAAAPAATADANRTGGLAVLVDAVIEAAAERIAGQGALAAIAASDDAASGDAVAEVVVERGLATAGLEDLARRRVTELVLQYHFQQRPPVVAPMQAADPKQPSPRVKPAPSR